MNKPEEPTLEQCFEMVEDGRKYSDGHFTLLSFTTGWKAVFETPVLTPLSPEYDAMFEIPMNSTPQGAILDAFQRQREELGI